MTLEQFESHMNRLCDVFGDKNYPAERKRIIWREVNALSDKWWKSTVDELIATHRLAPLADEIRVFVSKERDRNWFYEKQANAKESEAAMARYFDQDTIASILGMVKEKMEQRITESDFLNFTRNLKELAPHACKHCDNSGLIFRFIENYEWVFRCVCFLGTKQARTIPIIEIGMIRIS